MIPFNVLLLYNNKRANIDGVFMLTKEYLKSVVFYDQDSGQMTWKKRPVWHFKTNSAWLTWNKRYAGKPAVTIDGKGYRVISINTKRYLVHRLVWLYVYGVWPKIIDHINGIKTDNRLCNLRNVSHGENHKNMKKAKNNTSGVTGVYFNKNRNLWCAQMKHNGVTYHIGSSKVFEEAVKMRKNEEAKLNFSKRHGFCDA